MATTVDKETDARFWAQTNYKPGHPLDKNDPNDAKMIPVWVDIHAKVQAESDAGNLVTTFDHPVVAQNIAEAHDAHEAAAAHLDAAAAAPDAQTARHHAAAAADASKTQAKKTQDAAAVQPSSASPEKTAEASDAAKKDPPPAHAHGKHHLGHHQAAGAHTHVKRGVVNKETDARFWAQTGYKSGQKLDPHDPDDAKMIPVWSDIHAKVQAEADAGKLVTTYDHPVVAQNLADAHAADQAAAQHLDAAATAPDPATADQHVTAAAAATNDSKKKTEEAAKVQPPSTSPQLVKDAAHAAAAQPPAANAPGKAQVANAQTRGAHKPHPHGVLDKETYARFWAQTHYKPGQLLDPSNATDAKMMPVWSDIRKKVIAESTAGALVLTYNHPVVAQSLTDAHVADQIAAAHLDHAAALPPQAAQQQVAAAAMAAQIAQQKTREVARMQPPSVSPQLAAQAAYAPVLRSPMGREQLAQQQAAAAATRAAEVHRHHRHHGRRMRSTVHPQNLQGYRQGALELAHGHGPYVVVIRHPDGRVEHHPFRSRAELEHAYAQVAEHHNQYQYVAAFDTAASPTAPVHDSVGVPAAEHADVPPEAAAGAPATPPDGGASASDGGASTEPPPSAPSDGESHRGGSAGKVIAIGAAIAAVGGLAFAATRSKKVPRSPRFALPGV